MNTFFGRAALVGMVIALVLAGPAKSWAQETVHGLQQAGWVIVKKTDADEWRAGLPPYENLRRLIYVVTYTLEKEGESMTCTLARDMMFDTSEQKCSRTK